MPPYFDGDSYEPKADEERLGRQLDAVRDYLLAHEWVTLPELRERIHASEASLSARIRDLRKPRFGAYVIERRRVDGGLYAYRVKR